MAYRRAHGVDTGIVRIFNTYGPRMRPDDGRAIPNFIRAGAARRADHGGRRRGADPLVLLRRRPGRRAARGCSLRAGRPGEPRQPAGVHGAGAGRADPCGGRLVVAGRVRAPPAGRPHGAAAGHLARPGRARLGAGGRAGGGPEADDRVDPRGRRRRGRGGDRIREAVDPDARLQRGRDASRTVVKQALDVDYPCEIELVVVDDGSRDGTARDPGRAATTRGSACITHPRNRGKGAAIRTAVEQRHRRLHGHPATPTSEYDPQDIPKLLRAGARRPRPRWSTAPGPSAATARTRSGTSWATRRVTIAANVLFNSYIGDLETCFKLMPRGALPLAATSARPASAWRPRSPASCCAAGIRPYEVPISYRARTRDEGKKITWRDGVEALWILGRIRLGRQI